MVCLKSSAFDTLKIISRQKRLSKNQEMQTRSEDNCCWILNEPLISTFTSKNVYYTSKRTRMWHYYISKQAGRLIISSDFTEILNPVYPSLLKRPHSISWWLQMWCDPVFQFPHGVFNALSWMNCEHRCKKSTSSTCRAEEHRTHCRSSTRE